MAKTLAELRAKYGKGNTATENNTINADASTSFVGRTLDKTKEVAKKSGSVVANAMPATRGSVKDLAAQMNNRFNNQERETFKNTLMIHMIAQATGVNLPSDEEMDELYEQYTKEQKEVKEINETEALAEVESTTTSTTTSKPKSIRQKLLGNAFDDMLDELDEEEDDIVEVIEEEEVEEQQEEKPKGRRKLGRQAPLAE